MISRVSNSSITPLNNFAGVQIAVEYIAPEELQPATRQVRRHLPGQIKQIARSIQDFGFLIPILADEKGQIIAGHGRWDAAKLLKISSVPVIRTEHLTEAQRRLFAIADNKLPEGARWDDGALLLELIEIEILQPEVDLTCSGLTIAKIDTLYGRQRAEELSDCDEPGEILPIAVSQRGDRWRLGRHVLGCGDARDPGFLASLLGSEKARIVLTDPPWNLKIEGVVSGKGKNRHVDFAMAAGEMSKVEFIAFLTEFIRVAQIATVDGGLLYIFMDWRNLDALLAAAAATKLLQKNLLVWCKDNAGLGLLYRSQHELIGLFKHGDTPHLNNIRMGQHGRNRSNVLFYPGANSFGGDRTAALASHPTSKPVALLADIILDTTAPNELCLDLFGGSGSTLIAAEKMGRRSCLVEFDPLYVDGIIRRYEKLTGAPAIHIDEERSFADIAAGRAPRSEEFRRGE